ncbi:MAG: DUF3795 domain-containing protein [bacterium]
MNRNQEETNLTAYCGLYCGDCIRYRSKTADLARELSTKLQKDRFDNYAEVEANSIKELNHYHKFLEVLGTIIKLRCDNPCRLGGDGCEQSCKIKGCAQSKHIDGCWQCNEFEACDKFEFLKPLHGDSPQQNLRKIKEYGLRKWVEYREKFYIWL